AIATGGLSCEALAFLVEHPMLVALPLVVPLAQWCDKMDTPVVVRVFTGPLFGVPSRKEIVLVVVALGIHLLSVSRHRGTPETNSDDGFHGQHFMLVSAA